MIRCVLSDFRGCIRLGFAFTFPVSEPRFVKRGARWSEKRSRVRRRQSLLLPATPIESAAAAGERRQSAVFGSLR